MLILHHLNNSRSQRVLWLMEELGLEYEIKFYQRDPKTLLAPPSLRAIHPLGKSPVLSDGPVVMAESAAILEYLVDRYGKGRLRPPGDSPEYWRYLYWMHYAEGSAMPPLLLKLAFSRIPKSPAPFFIKPILKTIYAKAMKSFIQPQLDLHMDYMEAELGRTPWFAGAEFTAADIQMSFPVQAAAARGGLDSARPRLFHFLKVIEARPAYQRALRRGGEYHLLM